MSEKRRHLFRAAQLRIFFDSPRSEKQFDDPNSFSKWSEWGSGQLDYTGITDRQLMGFGKCPAPTHLGFDADQAILQTSLHILNDNPTVHRAVLYLGVANHSSPPDAGKRPDVSVFNNHILTDDDRAHDLAAQHLRRGRHDYAAGHAGAFHIALNIGFDLLEQQPVGVQQVRRATRVFPPALDPLTDHRLTPFDQALDAVGDFIFTPRRGGHHVEYLKNLRRKAVQSRDSQVAGRVFGLFDQASDLLTVELSHSKSCGISHLDEGDQGCRVLLMKALNERTSTKLKKVIAEINTEVVLSYPFTGSQDGVT